MSSSSKQTQHQVTHQEQGPEQWVRDEGSKIFANFKKSMPSQYKRYRGERVADYGEDYYTARDNIRALDAAGTPDLDKYGSILDDLYGMDSEYLGKSIQENMNPYVQGVLDPTIRNINEARGQQLNSEAAAATTAGAFGDPQAGLVRNESNARYNTAISDASNQAYSQAFDNAQNQRNTAMARLGQTGQGYASLDQARFNRETQLSKFLTQFGVADQARKQALNDVDYNDWYLSEKGMNGYATDRYSKIMQMLNLTPHKTIMDGESTTTTKQQDNSGLQMIGKLIGAVAGMATGNPAAAIGAAGGGSGGFSSIISNLFGGGGQQGGGQSGGQSASPWANLPSTTTQTGQFEWPSFSPAGYVSV